MFLRALALFAALAVPLLMTLEAVSGLHPSMVFIGPLAAVFASLPIVFKAKEARTQALFGAALAAMAAASTAELPELLRLTGSEDALPVHDLRDGPLGIEREGYVAVRGYLRDEWVVDEYAIAQEGERPDQNEAPRAVLLPLLSDGSDVVQIGRGQGRVVVARVNPARIQSTPVTLRGKLGPVQQEIVESLFVVQYQRGAGVEGEDPMPQGPPPAVLLDTFDVPTRGQALTRTALAAGMALLGLVLLLFAVADAGKSAPADPKP